jgi:chromosome segregation ATPase
MSKLSDLRKNLLDRQDPSNISSVKIVSPEDGSPQDLKMIYSVNAQVGSSPDREVGSAANDDDRNVDDLPTRQPQLGNSAEKMFESANAYRESWAKVTKWSDSIEQATQWLESGLEPMKALCQQLERLSSTFQPMHAFEQQLGMIAESFKPAEELHAAVVDLIDSFHRPLEQLAGSLLSASASKRRIGELAKRFEEAGQLQTRFQRLSLAFEGDRERSAAR